MKKVFHQSFSYLIPEKSGFSRIQNQGLPQYVFVDEKEYNQPEYHAFLMKILAALNLEAGSNLEIIPCNPNTLIAIPELITDHPVNVISFGITPAQLHLQGFELIHHCYHFQGSTFLFANSLKSYSNEATKKTLWMNLKMMFGK